MLFLFFSFPSFFISFFVCLFVSNYFWFHFEEKSPHSVIKHKVWCIRATELSWVVCTHTRELGNVNPSPVQPRLGSGTVTGRCGHLLEWDDTQLYHYPAPTPNLSTLSKQWKMHLANAPWDGSKMSNCVFSALFTRTQNRSTGTQWCPPAIRQKRLFFSLGWLLWVQWRGRKAQLVTQHSKGHSGINQWRDSNSSKCNSAETITTATAAPY